MKRRLPLGLQDFTKIREGDYFYVDKSARIYELLTGSASVFFLSRPRRFGKSLLCSTLGAIFSGKRELFAGLAIDKLDWDWKKHPVIRFDLNPGNYSDGIEALNANFHNMMLNIASEHGLELRGNLVSIEFANLIRDLHNAHGERVVVIIDEYDKPLLNTIDFPEVHMQMRSALKSFYGVLKSADEHLRFVFLTGVTKFAQVSIFSDLNHISDISLNGRYADLCGITQEELENDFAPYIESVLKEKGLERKQYMDKLKRFYNGYRFSKKLLRVYNPFGLLHHFDEDGMFSTYWYASATPTFLIKLIEKQNIDIMSLDKLTVGSGDFQKFDIEKMAAVPVLYQSGYLTIVGYDEARDCYMLDYPNDEVRCSFAESLIDHYLHVKDENKNTFFTQFYNSLAQGELSKTFEVLKSFFASIPYEIVVEKEKYFQTVLHLIFTMFGLRYHSEVRIAAGRIDALLEVTGVGDGIKGGAAGVIEEKVYCFEFKLDGSAEEALAQIDTKEYLLPWKTSGKKLYKVGVNFDYEKRNIGEWKCSGA
jgi:hypothetical protein